ncbi:FmdB family zinc ribbon protein [Mucispirillum schaedleri]|uniref:FmdB family zinc ribbon protein n=1 Tax=Mucispirillum schaedleri TaxID=248039 RepID=UPI001F5738F8|nr:zinc ribbon domain-containing protein [Mucispirillum schaedleri]
MPIYEYHCTTCGKDFEKMQSINNDERAIECVYCGRQAERKVSVTSYHLTGSGFYNTDKKAAASSCCPAGSCCAGGACNIEK